MRYIGIDNKYPSTTRGVIKLMKEYEKKYGGKEMPISIYNYTENVTREFVCIQEGNIDNQLRCHGNIVEL